jgi:N-acetylglutamate synthase-like GNAT family acetyltransferase
MKIRELEEGDFAGLSELILAVYDETPYATTFGRRPSAAELDGLMQKKIQGVRDGNVVDFVAVDAGKVVADCEIVKATETGGVLGIIVSKEHRGRGTGRSLLERSLEKAREIKMREVYTEIDDRNAGAAAFFARCGFKEQEGERPLTMVRTL